MISQGFSNKRIARTLAISPETVKTHVKRIFLKLAVHTRTAAVVRAGSLGLLGSMPLIGTAARHFTETRQQHRQGRDRRHMLPLLMRSERVGRGVDHLPSHPST